MEEGANLLYSYSLKPANMKNINAYLTFNGNCREAMTFYKDCLGGELKFMTFGESPMESGPNDKGRIMHANLVHNNAVLMASDTMTNNSVSTGGNFSISVDCENEQEIETHFNAMALGGKVTMPLQDTFWGARFGMLTDKFGIQWMFNYDKPGAMH